MFPKPSRTARKREEHQKKLERSTYEARNKADVRRRDRVCRFPICGCRALRLRLEAAHLEHKGAGGDPAMQRSDSSGMILFCTHRHQHGRISLHAGTLRVRALTEQGTKGPVAFDVDESMLDIHHPDPIARWTEVARERKPGELDAAYTRTWLLQRLATMDC